MPGHFLVFLSVLAVEDVGVQQQLFEHIKFNFLSVFYYLALIRVAGEHLVAEVNMSLFSLYHCKLSTVTFTSLGRSNGRES